MMGIEQFSLIAFSVVMTIAVARIAWLVSGLTTKSAARIQVLEERLAFSERWNEDLVAQVQYWRTRTEKLTDAALARGGEIHEPTMRDAAPPPPVSPAAMIVGAMSIHEFDSRQKEA